MLVAGLIVVGMGSRAPAEESPDVGFESRPSDVVEESHPAFSSNDGWTKTMAAAIAGLFGAAVVVGPLVLWRTPKTVPVAASHIEDPSTDGHS